jgi:hypothetical protein
MGRSFWYPNIFFDIDFRSKRGIDVRVEKLLVEVAFCLLLQTTQFMTFNFKIIMWDIFTSQKKRKFRAVFHIFFSAGAPYMFLIN